MKIIDAINKINKEEKFKFRLLCDGDIYKYIGGSLYNETVGERAEWIIDNEWLNQKIEILEEEKKIPEKLEEPRFNKGRYYIKDINGDDSEISGIERTFRLKINEIIDYLKSKGE